MKRLSFTKPRALLATSLVIAAMGSAAAICPPDETTSAEAKRWASQSAYEDAVRTLSGAQNVADVYRARYTTAAEPGAASSINRYGLYQEAAQSQARGDYNRALDFYRAATAQSVYDETRKWQPDLLRARGYMAGQVATVPTSRGLTLWVDLDEEGNVRIAQVNGLTLEPSSIVADELTIQLNAKDGDPLATVELHGQPDVLRARLVPAPESPNVRIGITMEAVPEALAAQLGVTSENAVMIATVAEKGPAARAGLRKYDVVTAIDGKPGATQDAIRESVQSKKPGESIKLVIIREGKPRNIEIEVEAYQPEVMFFETQMLQPGLTGLTTLAPADTTATRTWQVLDSFGSPTVLFTNPQQPAIAQQAPAGLTLQVQPRIVNERVVLDVNPLSTLTWTPAAGNLDAREQLRQEVAQLKLQIERLEKLIEKLNGDENP